MPKYPIIDRQGKSQNIQDYQMLLEKIGAESGRLGKLVNDITFFNQQYSFLESRPDNSVLTIKNQLSGYWDRVFAATMKIAGHIFEPPTGGFFLSSTISFYFHVKLDSYSNN